MLESGCSMGTAGGYRSRHGRLSNEGSCYDVEEDVEMPAVSEEINSYQNSSKSKLPLHLHTALHALFIHGKHYPLTIYLLIIPSSNASMEYPCS